MLAILVGPCAHEWAGIEHRAVASGGAIRNAEAGTGGLAASLSPADDPGDPCPICQFSARAQSPRGAASWLALRGCPANVAGCLARAVVSRCLHLRRSSKRRRTPEERAGLDRPERQPGQAAACPSWIWTLSTSTRARSGPPGGDVAVRLRGGSSAFIPIEGGDPATGTRNAFVLLMFLDYVIGDLARRPAIAPHLPGRTAP